MSYSLVSYCACVCVIQRRVFMCATIYFYYCTWTEAWDGIISLPLRDLIPIALISFPWMHAKESILNLYNYVGEISNAPYIPLTEIMRESWWKKELWKHGRKDMTFLIINISSLASSYNYYSQNVSLFFHHLNGILWFLKSVKWFVKIFFKKSEHSSQTFLKTLKSISSSGTGGLKFLKTRISSFDNISGTLNIVKRRNSSF